MNIFSPFFKRLMFFSTKVSKICHFSSSSSSCRAASMDIPDSLSPLLPIILHLRQVFRATSRILT